VTKVRWSVVELNDRRQWDQIVQRVPHSFSHTWEHCRAHSRSGEQLVLIHAGWSSGEAFCPLRLRTGPMGTDIATPFGFSGFVGHGDLSEFPDTWQAYARSQSWITGYHVINPWLTTPPWQVFHGLHVHNFLFALDLSLGTDVLYERLSRTRRRQLRDWQADERSLVTDRAALQTFVRDNAASFFHRINAAVDYRLEQWAWKLLTGSSNILMLGAAYSGKLVAATVFGIGSGIVDAMFNISLPNGRDAATFLMWNGALHFAERGIRRLNMGGGLVPGDSYAESKRRFGGEEVQFAALRQVYDWPRYQTMCRNAGCDTSTTARYFPPYLSRATAGVPLSVH
jgi:hypothetical protein